MKVLIVDWNIEYSKILICSKIEQCSISFQLIPRHDNSLKNKEPPILLIDGSSPVETANEICRVIRSPSECQTKSVIGWMKWEEQLLRPYVNETIKGTGNNKLEALLNILNYSLSNGYLVCEDNITIADIVLWCCLYPMFSRNDNILKSYNNLNTWFNKLGQLSAFQNCTEEQNKNDVIDSPRHRTTKSEIPRETALKDWENNIKIFQNIKPPTRKKIVLPKAGGKNVLITSALPYVNNVPHLGNIIGCVLSADVFSRYCRLRGWNTLYICGTDEYGTATETKALEEGLSPKEICDKYFEIHKDIYTWFNIEFDLFGRTTDPSQTELVQDMFKECNKNGFTVTETVDQLLCEKCDRFLADRFVEGICPGCKFIDARGDQCDGCGHLINAVELIEPKCKVCRTSPVVTKSQQFFLDLPKLEPKIKTWFDESSKEWSRNAREITRAWLKDGLKPRCITRDLKWGISVPLEGFQTKVFYVWFDAPIGYLSMTKSYCGKDWIKWWKPDPGTEVQLYQFMAKDNVPFHSIMFPATLLSTNKDYILVNHLLATEYLNYEDGKFSKSRGIGVFGNDAKNTGIPSDVFRFYLLYVRPEVQDSSFCWLDLASKCNTELLNNLGNFVNRGLMFSGKFFDSKIPPIIITDEERNLICSINDELAAYRSELEKGRLRDGIKFILNISRLGNQYIQTNQPWVLIKGSPAEKERAGTVTGFVCNMVCLLSVMLQPYMPNTSRELQNQTNLPLERFILTEYFQPFLEPGHTIGKPVPLFSKIEPSTIDALREKYSGKQGSPAEINHKPVVENNEANLQELIAKQGDKVRALKMNKADPTEIKKEVALLLSLKAALPASNEESSTAKSKKKKKK